MRFIAIDLKVAGNNPRVHNILEVGAVIGDFQDRNISGTYQCFVKNETIKGEPSVLASHMDIVSIIGKKAYYPEFKFLDIDEVAQDFANWLNEAGYDEKITFASRNFLNFVERYLKRIPNWLDLIKYHRHKSLDVGSMYFDPSLDDTTPSLKECMKRGGVYGLTDARAVDEATIVKRLLYRKYPQRLRVTG